MTSTVWFVSAVVPSSHGAGTDGVGDGSSCLGSGCGFGALVVVVVGGSVVVVDGGSVVVVDGGLIGGTSAMLDGFRRRANVVTAEMNNNATTATEATMARSC